MVTPCKQALIPDQVASDASLVQFSNKVSKLVSAACAVGAEYTKPPITEDIVQTAIRRDWIHLDKDHFLIVFFDAFDAERDRNDGGKATIENIDFV